MKTSSKPVKNTTGAIEYTKTDIKDLFNSLDPRKKGSLPGANSRVFSMNSNHKMPTGSVGLPDHMIFTPQGPIFIEVKMKSTKDRLSEVQLDLQIYLQMHGYHYFIVTAFEEAAHLRNAIYRAALERTDFTTYVTMPVKSLDD